MSSVKIVYSGRVQGVGFRFRTRLLAERFAVSGYVKNLPDGRVELVAQGDMEEIDRFRRDIRVEMRGLVHHEEDQVVNGGLDEPVFESFTIAY